MKIFIVSTGRTGTSFLGHRLDEFEGINAEHEPNPEMGKEGSRYIRWKNKSLHHATFRHYLPMGFYYRKKFEWSRKKLMDDQRIYLESNSELTGILDLVKKTFPDALIVHILRDPIEVVRSSLSKGFFFDRDENLKKRRVFMNAWKLDHEEWESMSPVQRASEYYVECNKRIEEHNPDLTLFFDRIFYEPHDDFEKLVSTIDIDSLSNLNNKQLFSEKKNSSGDYILPEFEEWKPKWQEWLRPAQDYFENKRNQVDSE